MMKPAEDENINNKIPGDDTPPTYKIIYQPQKGKPDEEVALKTRIGNELMWYISTAAKLKKILIDLLEFEQTEKVTRLVTELNTEITNRDDLIQKASEIFSPE